MIAARKSTSSSKCSGSTSGAKLSTRLSESVGNSALPFCSRSKASSFSVACSEHCLSRMKHARLPSFSCLGALTRQSVYMLADRMRCLEWCKSSS